MFPNILYYILHLINKSPFLKLFLVHYFQILFFIFNFGIKISSFSSSRAYRLMVVCGLSADVCFIVPSLVQGTYSLMTVPTTKQRGKTRYRYSRSFAIVLQIESESIKTNYSFACGGI